MQTVLDPLSAPMMTIRHRAVYNMHMRPTNLLAAAGACTKTQSFTDAICARVVTMCSVANTTRQNVGIPIWPWVG